MAVRPSHALADQAGGVEGGGGRQPSGVQRLDLVHDAAVPDHAAGVSAGVDGHAGLVGFEDPLRPPLPQRAHVGRVTGELGLRPRGDVREGGDVDERGDNRHALFDETRQVPGSRPVACSMQSIPASSMSSRVSSAKQCAVTRALHRGRPDGVLDRRGREAGGEVAGVTVDPVPHELDPAVAGPGLLTHGLHQALRLHLDGEAPEVPPGPGDMPAGADDPRQVRPLLEPAGVVHGAGVADQQRAGVAVGQWPVLPPAVLGDVPAGAEPDVAVRVDRGRG